MKREIENKINVMIKTFTQDISAFLNNMEEVVEEKEKLKTFDLNQSELETLREQMKEKIHIQTKLRTEIEILRIENNRLKALSNNNTRSN
jgi:cell shape-determining protein MreC